MALDISTAKLDPSIMSEPHKLSVCLIVFLLVRLRNDRPMSFRADVIFLFFPVKTKQNKRRGEKPGVVFFFSK